MLKAFQYYSRKHQLFKNNQRILLGVSGGIDSMVMLDLFLKAKIPVAIAHCNFKLRGDESDEEQSFIQTFAHETSTPFFTKDFETIKWAEENKLSIQMAARDLRYQWFESLRVRHEYDYIAVGHNLDDSIETFFINLIRGTGYKGLSGIKPKNNLIIRPILFASRKEISEYASIHAISYREDSSNRQTKYLRNKIRHEIIPLFRNLNEHFYDTMSENFKRWELIGKIVHDAFVNFKNQAVKIRDDVTYLDIGFLKQNPELPIMLYELLHEFNFNASQVQNILECLDAISGKKFHSPTHTLLKDREEIIIWENTPTRENAYFYIEEDSENIEAPISLSISKYHREHGFSFSKDEHIAHLDFDKLQFPLLLRKWKSGDYFKPLGMSGIKKISDFLIDQKVSLYQKENTWVITDAGKIVWIVGKRIDDRYKITAETKYILEIRYIE